VGCLADIDNGVICPNCEILLANIMGRCEHNSKKLCVQNSNLPVYAVCSYDGTNKKIIYGWKTKEFELITKKINIIVRNLVVLIYKTIENIIKMFECKKVYIVPIPSRSVKKIKRQIWTTEIIANAVLNALTECSISCEYKNVLRRINTAKEQVGLGTLERSKNRLGTTYLYNNLEIDSLVILIDDVLTTGASILDAERVLAESGIKTICAIVLASNPSIKITRY
jgi:predicted amidophosphoribosyltransferase